MYGGLNEKECAVLQTLFATNEHIAEVILYGSRAKGNYKPFSDVDIVLVGNDLSRTDINRLYANWIYWQSSNYEKITTSYAGYGRIHRKE